MCDHIEEVLLTNDPIQHRFLMNEDVIDHVLGISKKTRGS